MSIYKPNPTFLIKQIESIDAQNYPLTLVVRNDDPDDINREGLIKKYLKHNELLYIHGKDNLGYVGSFEKLVTQAKTDYIVFSDQDDIWKPDRISKAVEEMEIRHSILCICDRSIIDANGHVLVASDRLSNPKQAESCWNTGDDITVQAASTCYGIGMAMAAQTKAVQTLLPFPPHTGHDLWIVCGCSEMGVCSFLNEQLVEYRRYGKNVSGLFNGISSKQEWYDTRIPARKETAEFFERRFPDSKHLDDIKGFISAREKKSIPGLFHYRWISPMTAWFEIGLKLIPSPIFNFILKIIKK